MHITEHDLKQLKDARELISDIKRWTRHVSAKDINDKIVYVLSDNAVKWCASGALMKICYNNTGKRVEMRLSDSLNNASRDLYCCCYISTNDRMGHKAIINVFDRAINEAINELEI